MDEVRLRFHASIYPAAAVRTVAERWSGVARFDVEEGEHDVRVTARDVPARLLARFEGEFGNHVLAAVVEGRRGC
jgi:hypothetical protein